MEAEQTARLTGTRRRPWARTLLRNARRKPLGTFGVLVLVFMASAGILAPWISPYDPYLWLVGPQWGGPSTQNWMGTDQYGRDVLSRLMLGARVSLSMAAVATVVGTSVGAIVGLVSGYVRGILDLAVQRMIDIMMSFPTIVLAMAIVVALGVTTTGIIVALSLPMIPRVARVVRATAMTAREFTYVEAARALGAREARVMFLHVLPVCVAPFIVIATVQIGFAIVVEASLGFLGLGVQPPTPTWGQMLNGATSTFQYNPWLSVFPGLCIAITVFGINLFGDTLRDALDPKLRGR